MKLIRLTLINIKNSFQSNRFMSLLLIVGIILCFVIFIQFNENFIDVVTGAASLGGEHNIAKLGSQGVAISMNNAVDYKTAEGILDILTPELFEYVIFRDNLSEEDTAFTKYDIECADVIFLLLDNYPLVHELNSRNLVFEMPQSGHIYLSNLADYNLIERSSEGLGALELTKGRKYIVDLRTVGMYGRVIDLKVNIIMSAEDFAELYKVDEIFYVYKEGTSLRKIKEINEKISKILPDASFTINNIISYENKDELISRLNVELPRSVACILFYNIVFTYFMSVRMKDVSIMRLFGMKRFYSFIMIMTEFLIYNIVAYVFTTAGFIVYWLLAGGERPLTLHLKYSLNVVIILILMNIICVTITAARSAFRTPVNYKNE